MLVSINIRFVEKAPPLLVEGVPELYTDLVICIIRSKADKKQLQHPDKTPQARDAGKLQATFSRL